MVKYKCEECGGRFSSYNKTPKFCSMRCKGDSQASDIDAGKMILLYEEGKTQAEVGEYLGVSQKAIHKAMRRMGYKARVAVKRNQLRENNDSWRGDGAGYAAFHRRLYAAYGKPHTCSVCGTKEAKNYDYASLTGNYQKLDDYAPMCRSCHWKYDKTIMNIKHMRDKAGGKNNVGE